MEKMINADLIIVATSVWMIRSPLHPCIDARRGEDTWNEMLKLRSPKDTAVQASSHPHWTQAAVLRVQGIPFVRAAARVQSAPIVAYGSPGASL